MTIRRAVLVVGTCGALLSCGSSGAKTSSGGGSSSSAATGSSSSGTGDAGTGVNIPGLSASVQAVYDANGLLHLTCATDDDCFAALGYFHASNRFFFMEFVRNLVEGSLASIVAAGQLVLTKDFTNRQWFATRQGEPLAAALYAAASPTVQGHLTAYAKGVNAWLGDLRAKKNGASLTPEFGFSLIADSPAMIRDWAPEDSAAVGLYVLDDLSDNSAAELEAAADIPLFTPVVGAELFSPKPVFPAYTVPLATGMPPVKPVTPPGGGLMGFAAPWQSALTGARSFARQVGAGAKPKLHGDIGSNDWVVAPSQTSNGHALLANDPHLSLMNPSIWFAVELDAKSKGTGDYHVAGSTFPGLPSIMVGHNEKIAWGVTTAYYDMADEYLETLTSDGSGVIFNGQPVPFVTKDVTFQNAAGSPVTQTLEWVPHHGPVVSKDTTKGTAVTIRWTGQDAGTDLDAFFAIGSASTVADAKTALTSYASSASQNFVFMDSTGTIGWYPYSKVPSRPWASSATPPWLPVSGSGSAEWQGTVPLSSLPQLTNPSKGFIATANNDMTGASADGDPTNDSVPAIQAWNKADGTREQRITDLLTAGGTTLSAATMHTIQGDTYSLYGSVAVPLVLAAAQTATLTPAEQAVVSALQAWKFTCPTGLTGSDPVSSPKATDASAAESIGCTAFHTVLYAIVRDAIGDEVTKAGVDVSDLTVSLELVERSLRDPTSCDQGFWDDVTTTAVETRDDILRKAITDAAAVLSPLASSDDWRWGRLHTLSLRSIFDSFGVPTYNYGPYAAPGGQFTVNVGNPLTEAAPASGMVPDYSFSEGPSIRFVVEATPTGMVMTYELPGGADDHPTSQFYNNLLPNWLVNQPIPFPFGPGAVTSPAVTITVSP